MIETPSFGPTQEKIWGKTQLGFRFNSVEVHAIHIVAGGYCSCHSHANKWNRFIVLDGELEVLMYRDGRLVDTTILQREGIADVPPGVIHKFYATKSSLVVECYWSVLDGEDIDRHGTIGGVQ